ncbi:MAG TPA: metal-dependent hydrolase [Candidatus Nanoarchaeia archaeon]|nr:metal-dependent hydrolase [Candidatus Nanoarchaeia archaeon]
MLVRTHLAVTFCAILLLIGSASNKISFFIVAIFATFLPDIDSKNSKIGHRLFFRPLQWFVKHRGFIHSFSFLVIIILIFAFFIPVIALPFFLGYGLHLLADSLTLEGISPFYPAKLKMRGIIKTGGKIEILLFIIFVFVDFILLIARLPNFL